MKFDLNAAKVNRGLRKNIHADKKYQGKKLDYHQPEKGHTKAIKPIRGDS